MYNVPFRHTLSKSQSTFRDSAPVARWSDVPWQHITGPTDIGLVAYHPHGIDRVEFYVNGVLTSIQTEERLNTRYAASRPYIGDTTQYGAYAGEMEYYFTFTPPETGTVFLIEAKVYAKNCTRPRLMMRQRQNGQFAEHGFEVYANLTIPNSITVSSQAELNTALNSLSNTVSPGLVINITQPGQYSVSNTATRTFCNNSVWITINNTSSGNVDLCASDFTANSTLTVSSQVSRLRYVGCQFRSDKLRTHSGAENVWMDGSNIWEQTLNYMDNVQTFRSAGFWATNSWVTYSRNGLIGSSMLARNCVQEIAFDYHQGGVCALNCIYTYFWTPAGTDIVHHADWYQTFGYTENVFMRECHTIDWISNQIIIMCQENPSGTKNYAYTQGIGWGLKGFVAKDCTLVSPCAGDPLFAQLEGILEDVWFDNTTIVQNWVWLMGRPWDAKGKNLLFRNFYTHNYKFSATANNYGGFTAAVKTSPGQNKTFVVENDPAPAGQTVPEVTVDPYIFVLYGTGTSQGDWIGVRLGKFTVSATQKLTWVGFQWERSTDGGTTWVQPPRVYDNNYNIARLPQQATWRIDTEELAQTGTYLRCTVTYTNKTGNTVITTASYQVN